MPVIDKILKLTRQLYPTGRVFKMPLASEFEKLHKGLAQSEKRAYEDALLILDHALPDNDNFTAADATLWEQRLGLISNPAVPLSDRKLAIKRKMQHPGDYKYRQSALYLQSQLQAAGFDVFVHKNKFPYGSGYITITPEDAIDSFLSGFEYGEATYGDTDFEYAYDHDYIYDELGTVTKVVNHIDESMDSGFSVTNLRQTFFICAETLGQFADVSEERKDEFRQLVLRIKPAHTVGYLLINYV